MNRYEPCRKCGRPTAVSSRTWVMAQHTRTEYHGLLTLSIRCAGSRGIYPTATDNDNEEENA